MAKTVGVLAVQGAFIEHIRRLEELGARCVELRQGSDLDGHLDALVLPGGESTVQAKLLLELDMLDRIRELVAADVPVLGTCAGLILLAREVEEGIPAAGDPDAPVDVGETSGGAIGSIPATVRRNAYGRQLGSFHANGTYSPDGSDAGSIPLTFIRAPRIVDVDEEAGAVVLVELDGEPVGVRFRNQLGITFHPELDGDTRIHELLLSMA